MGGGGADLSHCYPHTKLLGDATRRRGISLEDEEGRSQGTEWKGNEEDTFRQKKVGPPASERDTRVFSQTEPHVDGGTGSPRQETDTTDQADVKHAALTAISV